MATQQQQPVQSNAPASDRAPAGGGDHHGRGGPGPDRRVKEPMHVAMNGPQGGAAHGQVGRGQRQNFLVQNQSPGTFEDSPASETGQRAVHVLVRRGQEVSTTPLFSIAEGGEGVAVFSHREKAQLYLQIAGWDETFEPATLSPPDLEKWLDEAKAEGVRFLIVNPDRNTQMKDVPQPALMLDGESKRSGEQAYLDIKELAAS